MPLPFLHDKRQIAGLIIKNRTPDEKQESEPQDDPAMAIESCADALIAAVHAKDTKVVAQALKDAFDILESMPHEEVDHSYDAQNQLAAKNQED